MWSLEVIKDLNKKAAKSATEEGTVPYLFCIDSNIAAVRVPMIGDMASEVDEKHERIDTLFVDTSGWGAPDEPALTQRQFLEKISELRTEHGPILLALEECGQFQGYCAVWKAEDKEEDSGEEV